MSGQATVLIVEDEFAIADLLEMVLTDQGYRVVTAPNGRLGLQRLADGLRPDLVITDYMMPMLDGAGLLRAMRESEAERDIPCIVMRLHARGECAGTHRRLRRFRAQAVQSQRYGPAGHGHPRGSPAQSPGMTWPSDAPSRLTFSCQAVSAFGVPMPAQQ
ncbi:PleD family two-component system response regulator [Pseudoroseomonas wenyumeiae]